MAVSIEKLCSDAKSLIGIVRYTDNSAGEKECTDLAKLQTGNYTTKCAGLIVAICKAQGVSVYNGSNTMWRKYLTDSGYITDGKPSETYPHKTNGLKSSQLEKGMLVFKWQSTGEPEKYSSDGLGNYVHVGIVTGTNPLQIVHSTSVNRQGVISVNKIGTFCAWGKLKNIPYTETEYEIKTDTEGEQGMYKVRVTAKPSLRIRADASTDSEIIGKLPVNTVVDCSEKVGDWYKLADQDGYIHGKYVKVLSETKDDSEETTDPGDSDSEETTPSTDYVTREEFDALVMRVEELEGGVVG